MPVQEALKSTQCPFEAQIVPQVGISATPDLFHSSSSPPCLGGRHQALCQISCRFPAGLLRHCDMKIGELAIFAKLGWDIGCNRPKFTKLTHNLCVSFVPNFSRVQPARPPHWHICCDRAQSTDAAAVRTAQHRGGVRPSHRGSCRRPR